MSLCGGELRTIESRHWLITDKLWDASEPRAMFVKGV